MTAANNRIITQAQAFLAGNTVPASVQKQIIWVCEQADQIAGDVLQRLERMTPDTQGQRFLLDTTIGDGKSSFWLATVVCRYTAQDHVDRSFLSSPLPAPAFRLRFAPAGLKTVFPCMAFEDFTQRKPDGSPLYKNIRGTLSLCTVINAFVATTGDTVQPPQPAKAFTL